jgi:hypothetical protein
VSAPAGAEPTLKYHPSYSGILTCSRISGKGTLPGGQFDWGGRLPNGNGGARRFPQAVWKSAVECKGIRELDCETYKSSRCESRA